jgi:anti-anti-sigma regulatory factor
MSLEITTREFDRVIIVDVVGKLTTTEGRTQLRDLIHVFSETGHKRFLLNLAGVDYGAMTSSSAMTSLFVGIGDMAFQSCTPRARSG